MIYIRWEKEAVQEGDPELSQVYAENAALYTPYSTELFPFYDAAYRTYNMVLDKGKTDGSFKFSVNSSTTSVYYTDSSFSTQGESLTTAADGMYEVLFSASDFKESDGKNVQTKHLILESSSGKRRFSVAAYQRWPAVKRDFLDEPDRITDYFCIGSQFSGGGNTFTGLYGLEPEKSLIGLGTFATPISVGNFGGYIVYEYDTPITDNPNNPYGIDFIVYGNSDGGESFSEPGNVLVSEDGKTWYTLAGSDHYNDGTEWSKSVTYEKDEATGGTIINGTLYKDYRYVKPEDYPLHTFAAGEDTRVTMTGVLLPNRGGEAAFPAWGYADVKVNSRGNWGLGAYGFGDRDARMARNPYWAQPSVSSGATAPPETEADAVNEYGGDGFDLAWAVDAQGNPVDLSRAQIRYIKVQTASFKDGGATGEKSTEVNVVTRTKAEGAPVGKTETPGSVAIGGTEVSFTGNTAAATVSAPFSVNITAGDGANIYINSVRGASAAFQSVPTHKMLRIVVQEGKKEPWIGYVTLTDGGGEGASFSTVTFEAVGGHVAGGETVTITYASDMLDSAKTFPIPTWEKRKFLGWFDTEGKQYEKYTEGMPAELTLTAKWEYILDEEEAPVVNVTFRLIGCSKSNGDIDLSDGNYHNAQYQNWVPTKSYEMPAGSTMFDLFMEATGDAGLRQRGAEKNYVEAIWAPSEFGGHEMAEFTNGTRSGWMYTVNGSHPTRGMWDYTLREGDRVIWHYVNDYPSFLSF